MKNPTVCICRALCIADHRELSAESIGCQIEAVTKEQLVYGLLWLCCCRSFSHCGEEQSYNMQRAEAKGFFVCVCDTSPVTSHHCCHSLPRSDPLANQAAFERYSYALVGFLENCNGEHSLG